MTAACPRPGRRSSPVGAVAALLVVLVAVVGLVGAPAQATVPPGVPAADQSNATDYPALARLGRWNGTTFVPVAAGSIPPGHAIFLSHGWSPGYLASYQRLQAARPTLVTAWDPGIVNGSGEALLGTFDALAGALQAADPTATVVMFSWVDQSSTGDDPLEVRGPEMATEVNGHRLAVAIDQALAPGFYANGGQVHLIGHSFGANVVTTAALALDHPPRQLTLLDSPEAELARLGGAKNDLQYKLPRLDIGRGPDQTFVDNYISAVGQRYSTAPGLGQVVDVNTAPPAGSFGEQHSFAVVWYTDSVAAPDPVVGYGWSPLTGADVASVGQHYTQVSVDEPLDLREDEGPPPPSATGGLPVTEELLVTSPMPHGLAVSGAGATTANAALATTEDSLWLTFDLRLVGRPDDVVTIWIDGRQRSQVGVPAAGTGAAGSFVILYDLEPGPHDLSLSVAGATPNDAPDPTTTATLSNLTVASTQGIVRNLTADQTDDLAIGVIALLAGTALAVIALIITVVVLVVRRRRRRHGRAGLSRTEDDPAVNA